ncbi:MAG: histidine triad nucleotide-binding protein [Elusimicrobia bacterium]|nr:histidine triad nucleotide-binding protein [Elusimicrobiota bacterium]
MSACLFCRIVKKEIPANALYEDESVIAFNDVNPQAPVHVLVIPKEHVARVMALSSEDLSLVSSIHRAVQELAKKLGVRESGFRLVVNNGPDAGQAVDHLHYHLLAGRKFGWPPG